MKFISFKLSIVLFSCIIICSACDNSDDEDSTPSNNITATVRGVVSGILRNGEPIEVPFELLSKNVHSIDNFLSRKQIHIHAENDPQSFTNIRLIFDLDGNQILAPTLEHFDLSLMSPLSPSSIFSLGATADFYERDALVLISDENNAPYKLTYLEHNMDVGTGQSVTVNTPLGAFVHELGNYCHMFRTLDESKEIYFSLQPNGYNEELDLDYHSFVGIRDVASGEFSETSALYGSLKLARKVYKNAQGMILLDGNFTDLSTTTLLSRDEASIKNIDYDPNDGKLSYDFVIEMIRQDFTVDGNRINTTHHPLKITGTVDCKIYNVVR
ncbi:hypothetical protein [Pseudochryseolinea flava]|nr:hypothetical protein [Pseudochryseolinea flava]